MVNLISTRLLIIWIRREKKIFFPCSFFFFFFYFCRGSTGRKILWKFLSLLFFPIPLTNLKLPSTCSMLPTFSERPTSSLNAEESHEEKWWCFFSIILLLIEQGNKNDYVGLLELYYFHFEVHKKMRMSTGVMLLLSQ